MPFRQNFFGDKYAQPGTTMGEIDDHMTDKYGDVPTVYNATIDDDDGDSDFKFGGRISWNPIEGGDETYIEDLSFDGFDSIEDARRWLIEEIGVDEDLIELEAE